MKPDLQNRDEIRDSQVKLGQCRLNRDGWTLCKVSRRRYVQEAAPPEKIQNLRSSNCWKCIEIVNPAITNITALFPIILFILRSHRRTFSTLGGCVRTPRTPLPTGLPGYGSTNRVYLAIDGTGKVYATISLLSKSISHTDTDA